MEFWAPEPLVYVLNHITWTGVIGFIIIASVVTWFIWIAYKEKAAAIAAIKQRFPWLDAESVELLRRHAGQTWLMYKTRAEITALLDQSRFHLRLRQLASPFPDSGDYRHEGAIAMVVNAVRPECRESIQSLSQINAIASCLQRERQADADLAVMPMLLPRLPPQLKKRRRSSVSRV